MAARLYQLLLVMGWVEARVVRPLVVSTVMVGVRSPVPDKERARPVDPEASSASISSVLLGVDPSKFTQADTVKALYPLGTREVDTYALEANRAEASLGESGPPLWPKVTFPCVVPGWELLVA